MKYNIGDVLVADYKYQRFIIQIINIKRNVYYYKYIHNNNICYRSIDSLENSKNTPRFRLINNEEKLELL